MTTNQTPISTTVIPHGRWCPQHQRNECTARNAAPPHNQCHGIAVFGLMHCWKHAGVNVETSAAHLAALQQIRNPLHGEPMDIGPAEALLWRVRHIAGELQRIDAYLAGLNGTETVTVRTVTADGTTKEYRETLLTIWTNLRERREKALHDACQAALQANIQERMVDIARQEATLFQRLVLAVVGDLGIDPADPRVAQAASRRLRELTA